jgi:hypothetical protein
MLGTIYYEGARSCADSDGRRGVATLARKNSSVAFLLVVATSWSSNQPIFKDTECSGQLPPRREIFRLSRAIGRWLSFLIVPERHGPSRICMDRVQPAPFQAPGSRAGPLFAPQPTLKTRLTSRTCPLLGISSGPLLGNRENAEMPCTKYLFLNEP